MESLEIVSTLKKCLIGFFILTSTSKISSVQHPGQSHKYLYLDPILDTEGIYKRGEFSLQGISTIVHNNHQEYK